MAKKVVVVDDSKMARMMVRRALGETSYSFVEAIDGADGLAKIRENKDAAIVLCDVNMPTMGGMEMIAQLHQSGVRIPIIMVTTEVVPALVEQAARHGAKGWVSKPFQAPALVAAVEKVFAGT
jgi:two-component system chemotaxis response regulator CheY